MSKEKIIIYILGIMLLFTVLVFIENTQESVVEMTSVTQPSHEPFKKEKEKMLKVIKHENIAPKTIELEEILLEKAQNTKNTKISDKVDIDTPRVERNKLIGGANVVWIEPKAKDPKNPFGEPPR